MNAPQSGLKPLEKASLSLLSNKLGGSWTEIKITQTKNSQTCSTCFFIPVIIGAAMVW